MKGTLSCPCTTMLPSTTVVILNHSPYSPDFTFSDFYLLPKMKKGLRKKKFSSEKCIGVTDEYIEKEK